MAKNIQIRKSSTVELPEISSYKLVLEAVNPQNMPSKIFLKQRIQNFAKSTFEENFAAVCTPTQLEDFPEDTPSAGSSYFRVSEVELVVRTPEMLNTAFESILYEVKKLVTDLEALDDLQEPSTHNIASQASPTGIAALSAIQIANLSTAAIQQLDRDDIQSMSPSQVAALTNPQIVALEADQIKEFAPAQLSAMAPAQVAAIEVADIPALTQLQVAALSRAQITGLTLGQLAAMEPADVASINPDIIAHLSPVQVGAFSVSALAALTLVQVAQLTTAQKNALSPSQRAALPSIPQFPAASPARGIWISANDVAGNVPHITNLNQFSNKMVRANMGNAASWNILPYSSTNVQGGVVFDFSGIKFHIDKISAAMSKTMLSVVYKNDPAVINAKRNNQGYEFPYVYISSLLGTIDGSLTIRINGQTVVTADATLVPAQADYYPFDVSNFGDAGRIASNQTTALIIEIEAFGSSADIVGELFLAYS